MAKAWLFSFNKPPEFYEHPDAVFPVLEQHVHDKVLPYAMVITNNKEYWYRWASIAQRWISESYNQVPKKIQAEHFLLKG